MKILQRYKRKHYRFHRKMHQMRIWEITSITLSALDPTSSMPLSIGLPSVVSAIWICFSLPSTISHRPHLPDGANGNFWSESHLVAALPISSIYCYVSANKEWQLKACCCIHERNLSAILLTSVRSTQPTTTLGCCFSPITRCKLLLYWNLTGEQHLWRCPQWNFC